MSDYSAPLSPVDIQKPPPNFQSEVLREYSKPNKKIALVDHLSLRGLS